MTVYKVVYERADDGNWSAWPVGLPVFSSGSTREEAEREVRQAIALYRDQLAREGRPVPQAQTVLGTVAV
jgi:predicted RNase H-like HicB family nuclease